MKLRNKKTGEIVDYISFKNGGGQIAFYVFDTAITKELQNAYLRDSMEKMREEGRI